MQTDANTWYDLASLLWYCLLSFWTVSGASSTASAMLAPPTKLAPGEKPTLRKKIAASKFYFILYKVVNWLAQNFKWAGNLNDPRYRTIINVLVRSLATVAAGAAATTAVSDATSDATLEPGEPSPPLLNDPTHPTNT